MRVVDPVSGKKKQRIPNAKNSRIFFFYNIDLSQEQDKTCEIIFKKFIEKLVYHKLEILSMALNETLTQMNSLLMTMVMDLSKVNKGNKSAAQRVRVGTVDLEKIAK